MSAKAAVAVFSNRALSFVATSSLLHFVDSMLRNSQVYYLTISITSGIPDLLTRKF